MLNTVHNILGVKQDCYSKNNKLIHRQFDDKEHEKRFRKEFIKAGHSPEETDKVIYQIKNKKFFTKSRDELRR